MKLLTRKVSLLYQLIKHLLFPVALIPIVNHNLVSFKEDILMHIHNGDIANKSAFTEPIEREIGLISSRTGNDYFPCLHSIFCCFCNLILNLWVTLMSFRYQPLTRGRLQVKKMNNSSGWKLL